MWVGYTSANMCSIYKYLAQNKDFVITTLVTCSVCVSMKIANIVCIKAIIDHEVRDYNVITNVY